MLPKYSSCFPKDNLQVCEITGKKCSCLPFVVLMLLLNACYKYPEVENLSLDPDGETLVTCPEVHGEFVKAEDSKTLALTKLPVKISGVAKANRYISYNFSGKAKQKFDFDTDSNVCIWVFDLDRDMLQEKSLSKDGIYIIQIFTIKGSSTFDIELSLENGMKNDEYAIDLIENNTSDTNSFNPKITQENSRTIAPTPKKLTHRVSFNAGDTGTIVSSYVSPSEVLRYLLRCNSNQLMAVKVLQGNVKLLVSAPEG